MIDPAAVLNVISDLQLRNARLEAQVRDLSVHCQTQAEELDALRAAQEQPPSAEK